MSTAQIRQKITRTSLWQAAAVVFGVGGVGLVGSYGYFYFVYRPAFIEETKRQRLMAPVRRTKQYISGSADGSGLLEEQRSMPTVVFYVYTAYRALLLWFRAIPIAWYAFLTFGLHLCSKTVFYVKVRLFLASMGPSYIKLGQWMATRPDFFPEEMCAELSTLFDSTPAHGWSHTEKMLRVTYVHGASKGTRAIRYLSEIEKKPVNSGSIAQVHRAKLREPIDGVPAGTELVVKVTHPHIREMVSADLAAMRCFICAANKIIPGFKLLNLTTSINEFSSLLRSQLNLEIECDNLRQFIYNFRKVDGINFPTPLPSLCSPDILFETFEPGMALQDLQCSEDNQDLAELGCHMFLKMLFQDNFTHSDLHPGNILLVRNGRVAKGARHWNGKKVLPNELTILDAGLVTTLSKDERNNFISLFAAVATGDGELGADLMLDRLPAELKEKSTAVDRDKFRASMKEVFDMVAPDADGFKLSNIQIGSVLTKVMRTVRENNTSLDGSFASLVLTVIVGEGLGRKLVPDFNIFAEAAPYLIAYLDDSELKFLANKLRATYGAAGLLSESPAFMRPERTLTYIDMMRRKGEAFFEKHMVPSEG